MELGLAFMITAFLVIGIWVLVELRRLKHKMFAIVMISIILFLYVSLTFTLKGQNIDLKTTEGIFRAGKIYLAWLGSALGNLKTITTNAIKMDWRGNASIGG